MLIQGSYFTIKDIGISEISGALEVYRQCEDFLALGPVPYASEQMVLADYKLSKEEGGVFCGIYTDGKMVGVVDFIPENYNGKPDIAYLELLMISHSHRRKGIGKDVVNAVEKVILKNQSIQAILSGVQVNNEPGIRFWNKLGYRITSGPESIADKTTVFGLKKDIKR